ncbi:hypothetical protein ACPPVO_22920 [Dactylosporangium sp. McL0621]|uniref:hypothetical protein n=1 Tax=Dactylosporangium sp. McL0621 TaxID=3415678 RepID=UPI003CEE1A37
MGWTTFGKLQPYPDSPNCDALLLPLSPQASPSREAAPGRSPSALSRCAPLAARYEVEIHRKADYSSDSIGFSQPAERPSVHLRR